MRKLIALTISLAVLAIAVPAQAGAIKLVNKSNVPLKAQVLYEKVYDDHTGEWVKANPGKVDEKKDRIAIIKKIKVSDGKGKVLKTFNIPEDKLQLFRTWIIKADGKGKVKLSISEGPVTG